MTFIKGNFKQYIFRSDKGYVVGLFKIKDASDDLKKYLNKIITFTGYFNTLNETDLYIFYGKTNIHEKYGEQFMVDTYEITLPNDKDNVVEFLSSKLFPKIGEKTATKIVEVLGENCLDSILNNPDILYDVPTVTKNQKEIIETNLLKHQQSYKVIVDLNKLGFSTKDSLKIYNTYKEKTMEVIKYNQYILVEDIYEISFKKIDSLKANFDIKEDDSRRIKSCIKYILNELSFASGNTYFSINDILIYLKRILFFDNYELFVSCLNQLVENKEIILEDNKYYLKKMYEAEKYIAERIFSLSNDYNKDSVISSNILENFEKENNIKFNNEQLHAIQEALINKFLVITGGPGTGKTTIIKSITKIYQQINNYSPYELERHLALLAPTGRASKRITEQSLFPSSTIHRFLKWNKEDDTFNINENNLSEVDFVIIDESSMIDTYLFYNLLLGLKKTTKIVLIGDYNQLPSVGPGQVLKDIIDSECVNVIKLNKLYRQEENSNISLFAYNINNNIIDFDIFNKGDDLIFKNCSSEELKSCLKEYVLKYKDMDINNFQVLAPLYKGNNGIDDLNYYIQELINKRSVTKTEITYNGVLFRQNDKVLQLVNNIEENIFNGDIGQVLRIENKKSKAMTIDFDSNIVRITASNFSDLKLGYCISIHKAQGSEFDVVIIPVLNKYSIMLYKKLIYTATTRAKKKLILIGELSALEKAILNDKENIRKTSLKDFIISCIK